METRKRPAEVNVLHSPDTKAQKVNSSSSSTSILSFERSGFLVNNEILLPPSFVVGMNLARMILNSNSYRKAFQEEATDVNMDAFSNALQSTYYIDFLSKRGVIDAYCVVYPKDHPRVIFFNPLLIMNMFRREGEASVAIELFTAVKIVHEVSHILNCELNISGMKDNTPLKTIQEEVHIHAKGKNTKKIVEKRSVVYTDFGELIEKNLFGGLIEAKYKDREDFMDIERNAFYSTIVDEVGRYIDCVATVERIKSSNGENSAFILTDEEFDVDAAPSFQRVALKGEINEEEGIDPEDDSEGRNNKRKYRA